MFNYSVHRQKIAPCKGCSDREAGCHSECQRYKDWSEGEKLSHDEVISKMDKINMVVEYSVNESRKRRRRYVR